jgi:hypothetical protein
MDWLIVRSQSEPDAAHFSSIQNYDDDFQLSECVSLKATFPAEAEVRMDPDYPSDIELVESLYAGRAELIVNAAVCQLFERAGVRNIELLPIKVINHKKKPVKDAYFVVNILSQVDCIDLAKSAGIEWNSIDPTMMDSIQTMVLDAGRLPADLKLFRPAKMSYLMLIQRGLAEQIQAAGMRGFSFTEIEDFSE